MSTFEWIVSGTLVAIAFSLVQIATMTRDIAQRLRSMAINFLDWQAIYRDRNTD